MNAITPLVRVEHIGNATLYLADCRLVLPTLTGIDAVVTSPPYDDIRDYGGHPTDCYAVIKQIAGLLAPGAVCVWNVADQTVNGSETGTSFRHALHALDCGLRLHDTMIVCRDSVAFPQACRYHNAHEYVFVWSQGAPKHFNGIRDWKNRTAGRIVHGTRRKKDGSLKRPTGYGQVTTSHSLRRSWWIVNNTHLDTEGHPAPMPYTLAADHVYTWTDPDETVLDPFCGSGTTGVAAVSLGRRFIGIEVHQGYFDSACRRIERAQRQTSLGFW